MTSAAVPRTRFTSEGDTVVVVRTFAAPRRKVWAAYTRPEHLRVWLSLPDAPLDVCEVDLRVGGTYRYRWQLPDGGWIGFAPRVSVGWTHLERTAPLPAVLRKADDSSLCGSSNAGHGVVVKRCQVREGLVQKVACDHLRCHLADTPGLVSQ